VLAGPVGEEGEAKEEAEEQRSYTVDVVSEFHNLHR